MNGLKAVRNNWKKAVFFSGVAVYGAYYLQGKYEDSLLRTSYCKQAKKFGDEALPVGQHSRRVTVFLNTAAQGGKAKKVFEKNVAPILHLAGFEVTIVKSEYEGQVKKYMAVLEDTDAIVVAGGNGLLLEVITGLCRRENPLDKNIPIGVMPLGYDNLHARSLVSNDKSYVQWLLDSAMTVVLNTYKASDVMYVQGDQPNQNVYCVSGMEWGLFMEAEDRLKNKNWWMGPLKRYWTYIRHGPLAVRRGWPVQFSGDLVYQNPCDGCSECWLPPVVPEVISHPWHYYLLRPAEMFKPEPYVEPVKDYSQIYNPLCGIQYAEKVEGIELTAKIHKPDNKDDIVKCIDVEIGPAGMGRTDFISEGWKRVNKKPDAQAINKKLAAGSFEFRPDIALEEGEKMFSIDGEDFECMPVKVGLLRDHLNFFYKPEQIL